MVCKILLILKTLLKRANGFQQIQSAAKQRYGTASVMQENFEFGFSVKKGIDKRHL